LPAKQSIVYRFLTGAKNVKQGELGQLFATQTQDKHALYRRRLGETWLRYIILLIVLDRHCMPITILKSRIHDISTLHLNNQVLLASTSHGYGERRGDHW
jgi:hypothetical protein